MSLEIKLYPDPILRHVAAPIDQVTDEIRKLADGMVEALVKEAGYGLAAPQVGHSIRLIVVDANDEFYILVNPEIIELGDEPHVGSEGCLSIPGIEADVERSKRVVVRGLSLDGEEVQIEAENLVARVFQHEVDHLNGVLFIDHLGRTKREILLKEYEKKLKESEAKEAVS